MQRSPNTSSTIFALMSGPNSDKISLFKYSLQY
jgi:hypothetical protein